MLYHICGPLEEQIFGTGLFQYITFRAAFAAILAFLISTMVGPGIIESLRKRKISGFVGVGDAHVDAHRQLKSTVPTMGGVILLVGVGISGLLLARLDLIHTWVVLLSFLAFGALGMVDDWQKLTRRGGKGLGERQKLVAQVAIAVVALGLLYGAASAEEGRPWLRGPEWTGSPYGQGWIKRHEVREGETWASLAGRYLGDASRGREVATENRVGGARFEERHLTQALPRTPIDIAERALLPIPGQEIRLPPAWPDPNAGRRTHLQLPLVKHVGLDLGLLFIPLGILVIVGASNAVNLTDGLDGLAIGVTLTTAAAFAIVAYLVGRVDFSRELYLFYIPEAGELAVILAGLAGGSLGFLWFNGHPASVFMGDTGSLSIGGIFGVVAVALRHEVTLFVAGGIFVAEALSVLWQRAWFKGTRRAARKRGVVDATGKRWFRCAPLHHHFEKVGWHENKVTIRFWIVSVVCAVLALASLKVR